MTATSTSDNATVGGVAGDNSSGSVAGCSTTSAVTATSTSSRAFAGGIVGGNRYGSVINCVALNTSVQASGGTIYAGRVAGFNSNTLTNCYANSSMMGGTFTSDAQPAV